MNVGIYIYELAEELDWAGPFGGARRVIQYDPEPPV